MISMEMDPKVAIPKILAIDGACHNNGKIDSCGCGACVIVSSDTLKIGKTDAVSTYIYEEPCTNQRAELHGLLLALGYINGNPGEYLVVTDSEYIYNAMTKEWLTSWKNNAWIGRTGEVIKNVDLWQKISLFYDLIQREQETPIFYHIKGHILSIGKVTRNKVINTNKDDSVLLKFLFNKYDTDIYTERTRNKINEAKDCSNRINGFWYPENQLRQFVVLNTMADCIASYNLDRLDRLRS